MEEYTNYIAHHGIKGQRWGIRRYQNKDGSLTPAGRNRLLVLETAHANETDKLEENYRKRHSLLNERYDNLDSSEYEKWRASKYKKKIEKLDKKANRLEDKADRLVNKQWELRSRLDYDGDGENVGRLMEVDFRNNDKYQNKIYKIDRKVERIDSKTKKYRNKSDVHLEKSKYYENEAKKNEADIDKLQVRLTKGYATLNKISTKMDKISPQEARLARAEVDDILRKYRVNVNRMPHY